MKKTGWYEGNQRPYRPGVYERDYDGVCTGLCYWTGAFWMTSEETVRKARQARTMSIAQDLPWRGRVK